MITNYSIARAVAMTAFSSILSRITIEDATSNYEGVLVAPTREGAVVCAWLYVCDDDMWMVDVTNMETAEVNPLPMTAENLMAALDALRTA